MLIKYRWIVQVQTDTGRWVDHISYDSRWRARLEIREQKLFAPVGMQRRWRISQIELRGEADALTFFLARLDALEVGS